MLVFRGVSLHRLPDPAKVGLLVGTLAQTKAGPEIQEANNDRLKPLAYGAERVSRDGLSPRNLQQDPLNGSLNLSI